MSLISDIVLYEDTVANSKKYATEETEDFHLHCGID
jgi:hypothetical protein